MASELLGVGFPSAVKVVGRLVEADVLREVTGRARNRVYVAHELIDLFSGRSS